MAYSRRWHNHLSDENDGNENGVDAIVCDYGLFMLFHKSEGEIQQPVSRTNERTKEWKNKRTKKVVLKLKHNIRELHGKAIKNICTVVVFGKHCCRWL